MLNPYVSQFNWVDVLIIICVLRMCYVGIKTGFGVESFKLLNLFFCSFVCLHFYYTFAEFLNSKIPALPIKPAAIFCYIVLISIITILFRIIREGFFIVIKTETVSTISKVLGFIIGLVRGFLISGLITFGLLISTVYYLDLSARTSYFGNKIVKLPIKIYETTFNGLIIKIFSDQVFNYEVVKVIEASDQNK